MATTMKGDSSSQILVVWSDDHRHPVKAIKIIANFIALTGQAPTPVKAIKIIANFICLVGQAPTPGQSKKCAHGLIH
jgi:hypothetical protein